MSTATAIIYTVALVLFTLTVIWGFWKYWNP